MKTKRARNRLKSRAVPEAPRETATCLNTPGASLADFPLLQALYHELNRLEAQRRAGGNAARIPPLGGAPDGAWFRLAQVGAFWLTPEQHRVACLLLDACLDFQANNPEVEERTLLHKAGSRHATLADLFEGSDAWGTLVIQGSRPTLFQLAPARPVPDARPVGKAS